MPAAPKRPCSYPRCPALVERGRCAKHAKPSGQDADLARGSSTGRGYDRQWRKFRLWFLQRHPMCSDCKVQPGRDVHHIKKVAEYPELKLVEDNCCSLCAPCHRVRTNRGE